MQRIVDGSGRGNYLSGMLRDDEYQIQSVPFTDICQKIKIYGKHQMGFDPPLVSQL